MATTIELAGTTESAETTVAIVGAGAAGALTALRLIEGSARVPGGLEIVLLDPVAEPGRGVAFGTEDERHLLNVRAGGMSARAEHPDEFVRWVAAETGRPVAPTDFVGRTLFGRYVSRTLAEAAEHSSTARLQHQQRRVTAIAPNATGYRLTPETTGYRLAPDTTGYRLTLDDGSELRADAIVLATGNYPPALDFASEPLIGSPQLVADPWQPGSLDAVPEQYDVLLVGTGLTMVDIAISLARPGRTVHAVSRSGLLPARHVETERGTLEAPDLSLCADLDSLRVTVRNHLLAARAQLGDWRPGLDSLRSQIAPTWQRLTPGERQRFLREDQRRWDTVRHRIAPQTAATLTQHRREGRIALHRGTLATAKLDDGQVTAILSNGTTLDVGAVVACTGPQSRVEDIQDRLLHSLLSAALARPGPAGLGLDTNADGRLLDAHGQAHRSIWTIGTLRRGNLWETTAIPEIRVQAAAVATDVIEALAGEQTG